MKIIDSLLKRYFIMYSNINILNSYIIFRFLGDSLQFTPIPNIHVDYFGQLKEDIPGAALSPDEFGFQLPGTESVW